MTRRTTLTALIGAAALAITGLASTAAHAQTKLRVFSGGQNQRPDLMRKLFDQYQAKNPGTTIDIETGGATSELQRQYLSTVLNAKDSAIDIYMIDIVNPAQYFGAGWLEPLNAYLGEPAAALKPYLPVYSTANVVDGKLAAMPAFADAMFMYYRKRPARQARREGAQDLGRTLSAAAKKIQAAEGNPNLQGLSIQGAPIEGAVCTFLLPYWGQGKDFNDAAGKMTLDKHGRRQGPEHLARHGGRRRHQEERGRGEDARHGERVQGRPGGVRDQLGLCLGPCSRMTRTPPCRARWA